MSIQQIDPERIAAVQRYLEQNFPNCHVVTFPDPSNPSWRQGYRVDRADGTVAHTVAVTYEFLSDTHDIPAKLNAYRLADELRSVGSKRIWVTPQGIVDAAN